MKNNWPKIRLSDIPPGEWTEVVILNPMECETRLVRNTPYLFYESTFLFDHKGRTFYFVVNKGKLQTALNAVPRSIKVSWDESLVITLKRDKNYNLSIKQFRNLNQTEKQKV